MAKYQPLPEQSEWGNQLQHFREDVLQLSRAEFAELLNRKGGEMKVNVSCGERLVTRWEQGDVKTPTAVYKRLFRAIGAPEAGDCRASVVQVQTAVTVDVETPANDQDFLGAIAAAAVGSPADLTPWLPEPMLAARPTPEDVGPPDVEHVRLVTASLRSVDQRHGGLAVVDAAEGLLRSTEHLLHGCQDDATATAMSMALASLARLTGWAYHDAGEQHRARCYLALAFLYAQQAGADSLAASIFYVLGRISLFERQPKSALRLFQLGQISAQDAANRAESARLYSNSAWAHAMMGNERQMRDSLARAEHEMSLVDEQDIDPWTQVFFTSGEYTGLTAVIYNEFAAATDSVALADRYAIIAVDTARASLRASQPDRPRRSLLFDLTTIATGCFRLRDRENAIDSGATALGMTGAVLSARALDRLRSMATAATGLRDYSDVRDVCHQVGQLALPSP
ncbi:hypothetical protein [Nocardia alni]|uniref:hypothetical protein n=1 Tax=Nocardia alni TaxID=2815723 RepID=UPI001C241A19|nr:hypothetical protein [Nocardia alni]